MNLPRHTLTSHASSPAFVNAQFHNVVTPTHDGRDGAETGTKETQRSNERVAMPSIPSRKGKERDSHYSGGIPKHTSMFACATKQGYFIARTTPLEIVARRDFSSVEGGLSHISLVDDSSLLVLVGGGRVPRFAPNKVVLWDEEATMRTPSRQSEDYASSSEGTDSPLSSTLFSIGREREGREASHGFVVSASSRSSSQSLPSVRRKEEVGKDDDDSSPIAMSSRSILAEQVELPSSPTSSHRSVLAASSSLVASSANLDDPFGAPPLGIKDAVASSKTSVTTSREEKEEPGSAPPHIINKGRQVAELEFGEAVKGICVRTFDVTTTEAGHDLSSTLLVVLLSSKAVVFELGTHISDKLQAKEAEWTGSQWGIQQRLVLDIGLDKGLSSLAPVVGSNCVLLALPGRQVGHVQIVSIALSNTSRTSIRSSIAGASTIIAAHANAISSITLSDDGKLLCTTSERGTLLRIWSTLSTCTSSKERWPITLSTSLAGELRRGSDAAKILSIAFSPDGCLLAAGSDKGTIHFFDLQPIYQLLSPSRSSSPASGGSSTPSHPLGLSKRANRFLPPSVQQFAGSLPPSLVPQYLKSQWSFAQFKVPLKVFSSSSVEGAPWSSPPPLSLYRSFGRHHGADQEAAEMYSYSSSGKQRSAEGAWAGMRGRIDDVRKGEKGIEEGLWLTWIHADEREKDKGVTSTENDEKLGTTAAAAIHTKKPSKFELVAISSSGSYYRIGVAAIEREQCNNTHKSTVLDMYREDSREESGANIKKEDSNDSKKDDCWLVEYQRFGMKNEWVD